jgi:uncharacterized protein YqgC (DUF456 family)
MEQQIYFVIAAIMVVLGLAGTILPVLPGSSSCSGALPRGVGGRLPARGRDRAHDHRARSARFHCPPISPVAPGRETRGASPLALGGRRIGGFIGIFFGIPGCAARPLHRGRRGRVPRRGGSLRRERSGLGTWLGLIVAAVAKVVIAFLMIGTFFASWILN